MLPGVIEEHGCWTRHCPCISKDLLQSSAQKSLPSRGVISGSYLCCLANYAVPICKKNRIQEHKEWTSMATHFKQQCTQWCKQNTARPYDQNS